MDFLFGVWIWIRVSSFFFFWPIVRVHAACLFACVCVQPMMVPVVCLGCPPSRQIPLILEFTVQYSSSARLLRYVLTYGISGELQWPPGFLKNYYFHSWKGIFVSLFYLWEGAQGDLKRTSGSLRLWLQQALSRLTWLLGKEPSYCGKAPCY